MIQSGVWIYVPIILILCRARWSLGRQWWREVSYGVTWWVKRWTNYFCWSSVNVVTWFDKDTRECFRCVFNFFILPFILFVYACVVLTVVLYGCNFTLVAVADQATSDSSIPLSPQWLYAKPIDAKTSSTGASGVWKSWIIILLQLIICV